MRHVLTAAVLLLALAGACGGDPDACSVDPDCRSGEICLWIVKAGTVDGRRCVQRCGSDTECSGGVTCSQQAVTCPTCKDLSRICAEP